MKAQLISPELIEILACPVCKSDVELRGEKLVCIKCHREFPIVDGIPVMLVNVTKHHIHQMKYFDAEYKSYGSYELENWRKSYIKRIFNFLNIRGTSLYLDIGVGGSGYTVIEAARIGCRAVGIDLSIKGIKKARFFADSELGQRSELCNFVVCAVESLPFKNDIFTAVSMISVLEHIPDDEAAIAEIARVTKPNGKAFISVPNSYRRIPFFFWLPYLIHDKRIGHIRHYSIEDLADKFALHSFRIIKVQYSGHIFKVLQIFIHDVCRLKNQNIWQKLEELDLKTTLPTGLQLATIVRKAK